MLVQDEGNGKYTKRPDKVERYLISIISRYLNEVDINNKATLEAVIQEIEKRIKEDLNKDIVDEVNKELPTLLPNILLKMNSYVFNQDIKSSKWEVNHNLKCKYPLLTLVDADGNKISADIRYIDNDNLEVLFNIPIIGTCVCYGVGR